MISSALLLPVATKNQLLGVISLGLRVGDLPFSSEDRQLLMAVSWQMAFAIQNAQLVQQVAEEERLRHELEIATTVQQRLFPQAPPTLGRLELAGVCHPARGVGGDYYDFIVLDDTNVGIAVADVAGKGISAALLMSTVQASLRSQAPSVNGNLTDLVSSMNRLLHLSTDASSYATFFYAQLDEKHGKLTYVNAGHNPPMLFRAGNARPRYSERSLMTHEGAAVGTDSQVQAAEIGLLMTGGPVIGAFHGSRYEQETIEMGQGDVLVAYTDGLTEARNILGEEFGEHRLRRILVEAHDSPPALLSDQIVKSVRDWSRDTVQEDDLTLVVIKLT
jgi:sigma-B regulation protein RsbU (phosphoserine phosphatase)